MSGPTLQYDPITKIFHLVMALMILGLLAVGLYMSDLEPSPSKWQIYGVHKALGITILALVVLRILWRATHPAPAPLANQKPWEVRLAKLVHVLLYAGMILMPISGYVMSSAGGHTISIFGFFEVPLLISKSEELGKSAKEVHEIGGNLVIAAVSLHLLGALKHHFVDHDGTLARMFGRG